MLLKEASNPRTVCTLYLAELLEILDAIIKMWPGCVVEVQRLVDVFFPVFVIYDITFHVDRCTYVLLELCAVESIPPGLGSHWN